MMDYAIIELVTVAQCDEILSMVALDRSEQNYKKGQLEKKHSTAIKDGPSIENDIVVANDDIASLESLIAGMPAGDAKKSRQQELDKARLDLNLLLKTRVNYGVLSKMKYEYSFNALEKSIAEIDVFIAAVVAQKATL